MSEEQVKDQEMEEQTQEIPQAEEKKYTEQEVDQIINRKFAKWKKQQEEERAEAAKLQAMTEQEKSDYEKEQLKEENARLKAEINKKELMAKAAEILQEQQINLSGNLLGVLVTDDAETTRKNISSFVEMYQQSVEQAVAERLRGTTPKKVAAAEKVMTKEDILNIKDSVARTKAIQEHLELWTR